MAVAIMSCRPSIASSARFASLLAVLVRNCVIAMVPPLLVPVIFRWKAFTLGWKSGSNKGQWGFGVMRILRKSGPRIESIRLGKFIGNREDISRIRWSKCTQTVKSSGFRISTMHALLLIWLNRRKRPVLLCQNESDFPKLNGRVAQMKSLKLEKNCIFASLIETGFDHNWRQPLIHWSQSRIKPCWFCQAGGDSLVNLCSAIIARKI
jgi:hypothetical protein